MTARLQPRDVSGFDPPEAGFRDRVIRGALITYGSQVFRLGIQFISVVVMSRLLKPSDFGILAMVTPIHGLAMLFQDLGLTQATIQRPKITHGQITALFWINLAIGLLLALMLTLLAPVVGWFYGDERVVALTQAFGALVILSALGTQHLALINRSMRFGYLAGLDTLASFCGFFGAIILAVELKSYWALFATPAISTGVTAAGAWIGTRFMPGVPRREHGMKELLRLGGGFTGFNVFTFIARNLDNVLIGHSWGNAALGLYDRAYKLLVFPLQQLNGPLARVMLPTLARLQNEPDRYRTVYLRALGQLLLVAQPGIVFTIATADMLVPTLLGEQWRASAPIFMWLGLAALQQPISSAANWLFMSQGRGDAYFYWGAINAATSTAAFFVGLRWGPIGVAAAYSITQLCLRMPILWWMATREGPVRLADFYRIAGLHGGASIASLLMIFVLRHLFINPDTIFGLLASLCVSYCTAYTVLMLIPDGRSVLMESVLLARSGVRRSRG